MHCAPHLEGPIAEERPAVVLWRSATGDTPLCKPCLDTWWAFARRYPGNFPDELVTIVRRVPRWVALVAGLVLLAATATDAPQVVP